MTAAPAHTPEAVLQALRENQSAPNGPLRNARAEELVAAAESTGDRDLVRKALFELIAAYEFSTERGRMLVPFARLMQEWDKDPSAFDQHDVHRFHWMFKWVSSGMLTLPEIPLATVERWLSEMERRYRTAGYSERAVRQAEFTLAHETGDAERAARAFAAWTAADRDSMADCHACELNDQGRYRLHQGRVDGALDTWAPVLDGRSTCAEEPHRVLAESLLPLVRSGRLDAARAHHLRGHRLARGNESLLPAIGRHIEFCALTGNEARGLEVLAEHAAHLPADGNPAARLDLLGGTLVLLRRLLALGHGDQPAVAYGGSPRTVAGLHGLLDAEAAAIAARFDARNGSTAVSERLRDRLAQEPLVERLPLGVRTGRLSAPRGAAPAPRETVGDAPRTGTAEDLPELVAEARRLRALGHPRTAEVWDRVAAALAAAGQAPDPLLAADLLDRRALAAAQAAEEAAGPLFQDVLEAYRAAGDPAGAALAEQRLAVAAIRGGAEPEAVRDLLARAADAARTLDEAEPARTRRVAAVELLRIRYEAMRREEAGDDGGAWTDAALAEFVATYAEGDGVDDLVGDAEQLRADHAWRSGDPERADALLASAVRRIVGAGRPWDAAEHLARRARLLLDLGRVDEAEDAARAAVEHGAELVDAGGSAALRTTLAEVLYRQDGKEAEAVAHALEAAHRWDAAGESAGPGAYARMLLAQALGAVGRHAEAAEVLESALPDLLKHGDEHVVRARDALARSLRALGDAEGAAEQYLRAAEVTAAWEHQGAHAQLATLAAECLSDGGLDDDAVAVYRRAVGLWETVGDPVSLARALRSLAWLEARGDFVAARRLMDRALAAVAADGDPQLLLERARTWSQTAQLVMEAADARAEDEEAPGGDASGGGGLATAGQESLALLDRAVAAFAALGPAGLDERVQCTGRAAWTERRLGRVEAAVSRVRSMIAAIGPAGTPDEERAVERLEFLLEKLTEAA
ncbi:tetratricopeptide repeat protein [Streptomyces sp. CC210A]|uniref:tetratricopeptide repeat protein n=1 Tax=Streptomyces sp. CC210A TaxID=2898184 RepID=UPI001F43C699|nr:tetratricopeptide repeat protein [Streptomyces sp. CC210A]